MRRLAGLLAVVALAGCAGRAPAPVADGKPAVRVESTKPARPAEKFYTVKKGDTLHGIALDHGVDYRELAGWNAIENPNRIQVGQQLRVSPPQAGAPAQPVAAPALEGTEVRAIAQGGGVEARPLEARPLEARPLDAGPLVASAQQASSVAPASTIEVDSATLKRAPKGGKQPYSEPALAQLKAQEAAAPVAAVPTVTAPTEKPAPAAPAAAVAEGEIDWAWPAQGKLIGSFTENGTGEANKGIDIAGRLGDPVQAAAAGKVVYVGSGLRGYGNLVIVRHNPSYLTAYAHNSQILVKEGQAVTRGQKIAELGNSDADQPKLHFEVRQQGKPVDPLKFLPAR
jgi:lipoprotein NlpD